MGLWGNINQEVPFCAKPEYEACGSSDEELRLLPAGSMGCRYSVAGLVPTKSPWLLLLSSKWCLMQNLLGQVVKQSFPCSSTQNFSSQLFPPLMRFKTNKQTMLTGVSQKHRMV